jgi:methyltransferase family protein
MSELEQEMTPLCHLARHYQTDKGGNHLHAGDTCHRYTPHYFKMFEYRRKSAKWILEIGVNYGASMRMWQDFFVNAEIIGLDSNEDCLFNEGRIRCFAADQYNEGDLLNVMKQLGNPKFDLIVDDGSHEPGHQIFSAQVLLPYLVFDGIMVIEDIYPDCQPQLIGNPIVQNMPTKEWVWNPIPTGRGLGKAHCGCGCGTGEQLVVIRHV